MKKISKLLLVLLLFSLLLCPTWVQGDTKKISGTTNVEDACIKSASTIFNYGGATTLRTTTNYVGTYEYSLIRVKNVASELGVGATNITAVCSVYCYSNTEDDNIGAYRVFKPWVEGALDGGNPGEGEGCTWSDWSADTYEWATAGCGNADDEGEDNSGDGTGADRKATAESSVDVITTGWYSWSISTELATGWYNQTIGERGIVLVGSTTNGANIFYSTEYTTDPSLCPFFVFSYTSGAPPEGVDKPRKNIMSGGIVK